jgi:hypothetical protein
MSTARSPTTWQPRIVRVERSAISCRNPRAPVDERPGLVEAYDAHGIVATTPRFRHPDASVLRR